MLSNLNSNTEQTGIRTLGKRLFKKKNMCICLSVVAVVLILVVVLTQLQKNKSVSTAEESADISSVQLSNQNGSDDATGSAASANSAEAAVSSSGIKAVKVPSHVSPGGEVTVTVQGEPNTAYNIAVHYSSSNAKASGLKGKTSDANGLVSWTWKADPKAKAGTCQVEVSGANQIYPVDIEIQK